MSQGNKRYLGDTFIRADNVEAQRNFFKSIIDTYQGKNLGTFNALTLWDEETQTEKYTYDFATAEQGEKAENALQSPVYLGRQGIVNSEQHQQFYTDAILIDDDDVGLMEIDWYVNSEHPNQPLSFNQALKNIYNGVGDLSAMIDTKLSIADFNTFKNTDYIPFKNKFNNIFLTFTDANGDTVTQLNAELVNGIRFIVTTQDAYDNNYSASDKAYWRNFFIIKDPSEIPPDYQDPLHLQLTDGYSFRVANDYLQVSNGLNDQWKNICSITDLLSGSSLGTAIYNYLTDPTNNYTINYDSFVQSLVQLTANQVDADDQHTYPFLSANLKDDFIRNITLNNSASDVTETKTNGFKDVNLDINAIIDARVNPTINTISSTLNDLTNPSTGTIKNIQDSISSLTSRAGSIESVNNGQTADITALSGQLTQIQNSLTGIRNSITALSNEISNWEVYYPQGLVYRDKNKTSSTIRNRSTNWFNRKLGIGVLNFNFYHYCSSEDKNTWVDLKLNETQFFWQKYPGCCTYADTISEVSTFSSMHPDLFIRILPPTSSSINSSCNIQVMQTSTKNGFYTVRGMLFYLIDQNALNQLDTMTDYSNYSG